MHAGVVSVRLKAGKAQEAVQIYQDTVGRNSGRCEASQAATY